MHFVSIQWSKMLRPGPRWGAYSALPGPLTGLRGQLRGWQGEGEREGRKEKKGERRGAEDKGKRGQG